MPETQACELLFFRHAIERKRKDGAAALALLKEPFESRSSSSSGDWEGGGTYDIPFEPDTPFSLIVGRFPKHDWMSIEFVGGDAQQVLKANKIVGRLEFLRLQFLGSRQLTLLEVVKKGQTLVRVAVSKDGEFEVDGKDVPEEVKGLETAEDVIAAIRSRYQCESPLRTLTVSNEGDSSTAYEVIKETGQPLKPKACAVSVTRGPNKVENPAACRALEQAIDDGDLDGVRSALAAGASVTHFEDRSASPLQLALIRLEGPNGEACAQALVDAGAPHNELLAGCFESFYTDSWCVAATKFLIKCGADVNERPRFGYDFTPLARAVHRHNVEAIKLLLAAGADPQAPILGGTSTILDWLRGRIQKTRDESEKVVLAEMLGLLSDK